MSTTNEAPCPDPSAHGRSHKLSEQASTAALYVTHPERQAERGGGSSHSSSNPLGPDGKLSSKSAAASLKYAKANELPSFPSAGLSNSADSAGKAAILAKDYKMKDLWYPEASEAGSRAALLAARDGGKVDLWQHTPSAAGNSAATMAMRNKGLSPQLDYGYTADGKSKALLAATLSVNEGRRRAGSTPVPALPAYPDSKNSAANALSAATASHRASAKAQPDGWSSEANQAARIQNLKAKPEWFGDRPPVDIDPEDTQHQAALHASAKSMAKQMYDYQNQKAAAGSDTAGAAGAEAAHARQQPPQAPLNVKQQAMQYIHLQDAAHKLAQERLAKVDKNFEQARYREYYGYGNDQQPSPKKPLTGNRMSMRGRQRKRASSEGGSTLDDSDDEEHARRIRSQMSQLNSGLSNVDEKKRSDDRAKLMAAAEKRVHARMHDMDEKVFQDTGKVPPAMMEEWDAKARKRAQEEKELQAQNPGKTHIGGGKYIDTSEIEAIAAARLKPTLDEISDTANKKRARDEEIRVEKAEHERNKREGKATKREEKDEKKRVKEEEKAITKKEKEEAKVRKEEEKRLSKDENHKSAKDVAFVGGAAPATTLEDGENDTNESTPRPEKRTSTLGRLASKLRRKNKSVDERTGDERPATGTLTPTVEASEKAETTAASSATPVFTTGAVGAEGAGLAVEDDDDKPTPAIVEPEQTNIADARDGTRETESGHSGDYIDVVPVTSAPTRRPDLERHITTIETSDEDGDDEEEEEDDDDEWDDEEDKKAKSSLAAGGLGNELSPEQAHAAYSEPETSAAKEAKLEDPTGPAPHTIGPHTTDMANVLDPNVKPDPKLQKSQSPGDSTGPAPHTIGPHTSDIENILDPSVKPDSELQNSRKAGDLTGPAPNTIGPHSSDIDNIVDPRVKPNPELQKSQTPGDSTGPAPNTTGPHSSDVANILDPRVKPISTLQKQKTTESSIAAATPSAPADKNELDDGEKERKGGLRGFLGKLRSKASRSENRLSKVPNDGNSKMTATATSPVVSTNPTEITASSPVVNSNISTKAVKSVIGADGALDGPSESASGIDARASGVVSPSSFRRGEANLADLDDLSSSGLDEDEVFRERDGAGPGKLVTADLINHKMSSSNEEEGDTFEEARDHFDESLAPPPAFAAPGKDDASSPVRGTKFVEEL